MENKNLLFLAIGLGICSATLLIERFVFSIPDWAVIVLMLLASVALILHVFTYRKNHHKH
ncbi:hypothetical protein [Maribacter polysaccharolyticus]|uniref:hypothetical protein n=1 Tax=Maribacter polysaccharolyticus TaxID=3020831 RepID=UPI00237F91FA|nr:hypothetical protein [Maribacter polysaccharolyticus]MDE3741778.1 hypothetical protein [Maribacter polysaccharolyticus]